MDEGLKKVQVGDRHFWPFSLKLTSSCRLLSLQRWDTSAATSGNNSQGSVKFIVYRPNDNRDKILPVGLAVMTQHEFVEHLRIGRKMSMVDGYTSGGYFVGKGLKSNSEQMGLFSCP
jgi:hypothetical protein